MKSNRDFRSQMDAPSADSLRKAVKLEPIRKSGKEKQTIYRGLDGDEDDELYLQPLQKRESVLDYMDDGDDEDDLWEDDPQEELEEEDDQTEDIEEEY